MDRKQFLRFAYDRGLVIFSLRRMVLGNDGTSYRCSCYQGHECPQIGKHPLDLWTEITRPTRYEDAIGKFWADFNPSPATGLPGGIGLHLGHSRIIGVDFDPRRDESNDIDTLVKKFFDHLGIPIPQTFTVKSGSGGRHYYFRAPDDVDPRLGLFNRTKYEFFPGVEILSGQRVLIAPTSLHKSGGVYEDLNDLPFIPLPDEISRAVLAFKQMKEEEKKEKAKRAIADGVLIAYAAGDGSCGGVNEKLAKRIRHYLARIPPAISGQGGINRTCNVARALVNGFALSILDAMIFFKEWNATCSPPWNDAELEDILEWADGLGEPKGEKLADTSKSRLAAELAPYAHIDISSAFIAPPPRLPRNATPEQVAAFLNIPRRDAGTYPMPPIVNEGPPVPGSIAPSTIQAVQHVPESWIKPVPRCPEPHGVYQENKTLGKNGLFWFPCKRLKCPVCREKKKNHYKASITTHLDDHARHSPAGADADTTLYYFTVSARHWNSVHKSLNRKAAQFIRIDESGNKTFFAVASTEPPSANLVDDLTSMPIENAKNMLCKIVDDLPNIATKSYTSSKEWALLKPRKDPSWRGWERKFKVSISEQAADEILECHKIHSQFIAQHDGFWGWSAQLWKASHPEAKDAELSLREGMYIPPNITIVGWEDPDDPDYDDTGPPDHSRDFAVIGGEVHLNLFG